MAFPASFVAGSDCFGHPLILLILIPGNCRGNVEDTCVVSRSSCAWFVPTCTSINSTMFTLDDR